MKRLLIGVLVLGMTVTAGFAFAGEKARDGRFIAYDNGTVLDTRTHLMWAARDNGSDVNWYEAKSYCENYRGGGYKNWRMPTVDELAGLYDKNEGYETPAYYDVYITEFIQLSSCCIWSSETRGSDAAYFSFQSNMRNWMPSPNPVGENAAHSRCVLANRLGKGGLT
jgi:hypothetical protein